MAVDDAVLDGDMVLAAAELVSVCVGTCGAVLDVAAATVTEHNVERHGQTMASTNLVAAKSSLP